MDQAAFCGSCGVPRAAGASFCGACGAPYQAAVGTTRSDMAAQSVSAVHWGLAQQALVFAGAIAGWVAAAFLVQGVDIMLGLAITWILGPLVGGYLGFRLATALWARS